MTRKIIVIILFVGTLSLVNAVSDQNFLASTPLFQNEDTIKYDGPNSSGFGRPAGGTFYGAVRFHPAQSCTLKSIIFFQYQAVTAMVWIYLHEEGSTITPGQKIDSISYLGMPGPSSWIRLNFSTPHFRAGGVDFWISIKITHTAGQTPLGIDAGPSVIPPHSFVSTDGIYWRSLPTVGRNNNFNIRAIVRYIQPNFDIGIDEILINPFHPPNTMMNLRARIKNYGLGVATNFPVACSILGAGGVLRYYNMLTVPSLAWGDTAHITFASWIPTIAETMTIIMNISVSDDVPANNREVLIIPLSGSYEDFELSSGCFPCDTVTGAWEWGVPTSGPGSAHSGTRLLATVLSGNYANNANWRLTSISFTAYSSNPQLRFWHWYHIEIIWDGGNVKISTDGGAAWRLIHPVGGYPVPAMWPYPPESCYGGVCTTWTEAVFNLPVVTGQQFFIRFHFGSDASVVYPGWYIDDVTGIGFIPSSSVPGVFDLSPLNITKNILNAPRPNPVINGLVKISFSLAEKQSISLKIYDASGRLIRTLVNTNLEQGVHNYTWNCRDDYGRNVAEGVYFYTLETPKQKFTNKLVLFERE